MCYMKSATLFCRIAIEGVHEALTCIHPRSRIRALLHTHQHIHYYIILYLHVYIHKTYVYTGTWTHIYARQRERDRESLSSYETALCKCILDVN